MSLSQDKLLVEPNFPVISQLKGEDRGLGSRVSPGLREMEGGQRGKGLRVAVEGGGGP